MWRIKWNVKRFWLGDLNLQRVDLADITGIRPSTIGEIMNDAHDTVSLEDLARICQALHRNVDEVLLLVKDTEDLDGEDRDKAIHQAVSVVRAKREEFNAVRRAKRKETENRRIQRAVAQALIKYGVIPQTPDSTQDGATSTDETQPDSTGA